MYLWTYITYGEVWGEHGVMGVFATPMMNSNHKNSSLVPTLFMGCGAHGLEVVAHLGSCARWDYYFIHHVVTFWRSNRSAPSWMWSACGMNPRMSAIKQVAKGGGGRGWVSGWVSVTFLDWPPMVDCGVLGCGSNTRHCKDTCLKQIGLYLQFLLTTPNMIVNVVGMFLV